MDSQFEKAAAFIEQHRSEMLEFWRKLVTLEAFSTEKENLDQVADCIRKALEESGADVRMYEEPSGDQPAPQVVVGVVGANRPGKPVVLSGHYDTVFKKGTFGDVPFRKEGDRVFGPGALDMKGGIVMAVYALRALNAIGWKERPVKIVFCGDEENWHLYSKTVERIQKEVTGALCAFNLETGSPDNCVCVGRKTGRNFTLEVNGVEAHSGAHFTEGRNAIEEMAQKIMEIRRLTDLQKGTTVSACIISGGKSTAVIPGTCKCVINGRFESLEEVNRVTAAIEEIAARTYIEGTTAKVSYPPEIAPIFTDTQEVMELYNYMNNTAKECGLREIGYMKTGGGSDAQFIAGAGIPVICGMGVMGEFNHSTREYALTESLYERTKLLTALVKNIARYERGDV